MGMERATFERVYDEQSSLVYRTAFAVLRNPVLAQDVVQDVFMRLWRRPAEFDSSRGSLPNYLRLVARSRALDVWRETQVAGRARARLRLLAARERSADEGPSGAVELRGDRVAVLRALAKIPDDQRQAIVLAYWGGLTADQIAERCDVPVGTIKSRIRLGLMKLRERTSADLAAGSPPLAA